jgi:hypothetical protein
MKNLKITVLIVIAFLIGASAVSIYASGSNLIMVPATINGYSTLDLLNYLATLKQNADKLAARPTQQQLIQQYEAANPRPANCPNLIGVKYNPCLITLENYNTAENKWVNSRLGNQ